MQPQTKLGLNTIGQIAVPVKDLERATAFYRDTLGMQFLFQVPNMAFFDCGGVRLLLGLPESPEEAHPASIIYYKVADIQAHFEAYKARGMIFVAEPHLVAEMQDHDLWMAFCEDSEANTLALMSEVPKS
ncbi:MAG: VOC family protein [Anaerolineales bacterium]|nr:VOC family protein [Anaerolineales bacterium]